VPDAIKSHLAAEGLDVTHFRPVALNSADVADAAHIIAINTTLSGSLSAPDGLVEEWKDVPPASSDYPAARTALRERVRELLDRIVALQTLAIY
jgi:hypothetical protein